ncbi:MAG: hypothetical protein IEMM0008_1258 [bacterium]|nr:MAG: hypothetical protein IEMM0008_1258 [bacterium]
MIMKSKMIWTVFLVSIIIVIGVWVSRNNKPIKKSLKITIPKTRVKKDISSSITIASIFNPPFSNPEQTGFLDQLVKEAFRRNNLEIVIVRHTAERAITNANEGIDDGDLARIGDITRLYPNLIQVPETLIDFAFVAFSKNKHIKMKNWDSLKPYSVGIITGWKILEENTLGVKYRTKVKTPKLLFKLLENDRVDIVLYDRIQGLELIKKKGYHNIHLLENPLDIKKTYLYLNKKHKDLVPKINKAFVSMKKDGTYKSLFDKLLKPYLQ